MTHPQEPILSPVRANRQADKRHYGVHPYFTRRPANVVRAYIKHYTRPGDTVLDPFGGSGVTAIEAMLLNRSGIHNDINPFANFVAEHIADTTVEPRQIREAFGQIEARLGEEIRSISRWREDEVLERLQRLRLPTNIVLPRSSDVKNYYDLFSPRQLLGLALLKKGIDDLGADPARGQLLLAWSATLGKLNKTFLSARGRLESRGGSSIFSIFRYKVARHPVELPPWTIFRERVMNVVEAKREVFRQKHLYERTEGWRGSFRHYCLDIADLPAVIRHKVDYIFTDPPYGGHIAYLDLSVLWNHWLGFDVPVSTKEKEIIVGGEMRHSEEFYIDRLKESIRVCLKLLKPGRWLSVVFEHWDTRYFEAILEQAAESGASLKAAVSHVGDTIWSMHKKKNKEGVLAGEMLLTFLNDGKGRLPKPLRRSVRSAAEIVQEALSQVSPDGRPFAGELLFNKVILNAWDCGSLRVLDLTRQEFSEILVRKGWRYSELKHQWICSPADVAPDLQLTF